MSFFGSTEELIATGKSTSMRLPSNLAPLIGKTEWGPNCWNATIAWHDPDEEIRMTSLNEAESWLASYTIRIEGPAQYGDIMVLRHYGYLEHTAIYLEPDTFFHKIGFAGPWMIQSMDGLNAVYAGDYDHVEFRRYVGAQEKAA